MGASAAAIPFDPNSIKQCMFLIDTTAANGFGHCGLVLAEKNGNAILYTFQEGGLWQATITSAEVKQFLKDGLIPRAESKFQFNKVIEFDVTPEEGRRMYDYAKDHQFRDFFMYSSFFTSLIPIGDNCLTFARGTMIAGDQKYNFFYPFGLPSATFYTFQLSLMMAGVPYTTYAPG